MDIIILDKQEITREGLRSILSQYPDCGRILGQNASQSFTGDFLFVQNNDVHRRVYLIRFSIS